jgi:SAM-dependent methyltransferase
MDHVTWHDVECGGYDADLALWRALADDAPGPVLDLGAGTGRVTLDLARQGHAVHALDLDAGLLAALRDRAAGLDVHTHHADARDFDLGRRFPLVLAPMQTVQLLGGADGRSRMLRAAKDHLEPGGLLVAAIAEQIEPYDSLLWAPVPDMREIDGVVWSSRPIAIRERPGDFVLVRLRERVDVAGERHVSRDEVHLDRLSADGFEAEARAHGFTVEPRRTVGATDDHVPSAVVMLRG